MPRPRFVKVGAGREFKHVDLDDGDWINLKRKLNYGEASDLYDATYKANIGTVGGSVREMRMAEFNLKRIMVYTVDWSFVDQDMKPVTLSLEAVQRLDPETADLIHGAINDIEREAAAERTGKAQAPQAPPAAPLTVVSNNESEPSLPARAGRSQPAASA